MRALPVFLCLLSACIPMTRGASPSASSGPDVATAPSGGDGSESSSDGMAGSSGSSGSSASSSSASSGPQTVSVTIRSSCDRTVDVFYGDKPKYSSGTNSSISSNSVQSKTFNVGDQMWVLDESGNGAGSVTISSSTHSVEINSSCTGIGG